MRALAYVNSAANALNRKIDSIKEAIVYLGRGTIRNWVVLYIMGGVDGKADEIVTLGLVRGRLCELLAQRSGLPNADSYFTVGLFSVLDALLDVPLEEALKYLPLPEDMQEALTHRSGDRGEALSCALSLEAGHGGRCPIAICPLQSWLISLWPPCSGGTSLPVRPDWNSLVDSPANTTGLKHYHGRWR